jgi:hypothetical protein
MNFVNLSFDGLAERRSGQYNCNSSQLETSVVRPGFEGSVSRETGKLD